MRVKTIIVMGILSIQIIQCMAEDLQIKLEQMRETKGFPGANLCINFPDNKIIQLSTGFADLETKRKMESGDRMFSGSVGKTYVSAVMLQLVSEGKIKLDDPISKYLSRESWFVGLPNSDKITLRMLMNHTSGIPEHVAVKAFQESIITTPDRIWKPKELLAYILNKAPLFSAGSGWSYADTNYILVGIIIERITGNTYYEELQARIIKPFDLNETAPAVTRKLPGLIQGYTGKEPFLFPQLVVKNRIYVVNPQFEWTGGGLITTASDLAKWAKLLYSGKVLKAEVMKGLRQAVNMESGKRSVAGYGLGVQIWDTRYGKVYGHGGIFPGYQSVMKYYAKYDFSIAFQVNEDRTHNVKLKKVYDFVDEFVPLIIQKLNHK